MVQMQVLFSGLAFADCRKNFFDSLQQEPVQPLAFALLSKQPPQRPAVLAGRAGNVAGVVARIPNDGAQARGVQRLLAVDDGLSL